MVWKPSEYKYQSLAQSNSVSHTSYGLGLFTHSQSQDSYGGHSFDFVPKITDGHFTDTSQGWLSKVCNALVTFLLYLFVFITLPLSGWFVFKAVHNYQRIVVFRLGRVCPPKGPGVVVILPFIDQWQKVDLRTRAFNIPPCEVTTMDGGLLSVGADIQFRIWNPVMSVMAVQDLNASTRLTAQNAMTHYLSKKTLREVQSERVKLGERLGMDINDVTRPWGLEVDRVELTVASVLQTPGCTQAEPVLVPPSVPGLEALSPLQELAAHFLGGGRSFSQIDRCDEVIYLDEQRSCSQAPLSPRSLDELLGAVELVLSQKLVCLVGACFQFHVSLPDGQLRSCYVDLREGAGAVGVGVPSRSADVTLQMSEEDLLAMFEGRLGPSLAYASGRLKVHGDLSTALKLEELVKLMKREF